MTSEQREILERQIIDLDGFGLGRANRMAIKAALTERDELLAACKAALEDLVECAEGDTSTVGLLRAAIARAES